MTTIHSERIIHPAVWKGDDFDSSDDFAFDLEKRHIAALDKVLKRVLAGGKSFEHIKRTDFEMPSIAGELARLRHELANGRGLVLIRGFPVDKYPLEELAVIFWGLGSHLGHGTSQSKLGDRLGYVTHNPDLDESWRGYRGNSALVFHTDKDDIVGLLCVRPSKQGGCSRLVSALAVHNEIAASRPDLLAPLYEGYHLHWYGEPPPDGGSMSPYKVPAFGMAEGLVSVIWQPTYMQHAAEALGETLPAALAEAQTLFQQIASREDLELRLRLAPGEASFINNYEILHGRTAFEDWPEPQQRRLMLRLWLSLEPARALHPHMRRYYDDLESAYTVDA